MQLGAQKTLFNHALDSAIGLYLHIDQSPIFERYRDLRLSALADLKSGNVVGVDEKICEAWTAVDALDAGSFPALIACSFLSSTEALLKYKQGSIVLAHDLLEKSREIDEHIIQSFEFFLISPHIFQNFVNALRVSYRLGDEKWAKKAVIDLACWECPIRCTPELENLVESFRLISMNDQRVIVGSNGLRGFLNSIEDEHMIRVVAERVFRVISTG